MVFKVEGRIDAAGLQLAGLNQNMAGVVGICLVVEAAGRPGYGTPRSTVRTSWHACSAASVAPSFKYAFSGRMVLTSFASRERHLTGTLVLELAWKACTKAIKPAARLRSI